MDFWSMLLGSKLISKILGRIEHTVKFQNTFLSYTGTHRRNKWIVILLRKSTATRKKFLDFLIKPMKLPKPASNGIGELISGDFDCVLLIYKLHTVNYFFNC